MKVESVIRFRISPDGKGYETQRFQSYQIARFQS